MVSFLKILDVFFMLVALAMGLAIGGLFPELQGTLPELLNVKLKILNIILLLVFIPIWHVVFVLMGLYEAGKPGHGKEEWKEVAKAVFIGSMFLLALTVIFRRTNVNKEVLFVFAVSAWLFAWLGRIGLRAIFRRARRHEGSLRNLLVIGSNSEAEGFVHRVMEKPELGCQIAGFIDDPPHGRSYSRLCAFVKYFGALQDFCTVLDHEAVDEVVVALPIHPYYKQIGKVVEVCELQGIKVHLLLTEVFSLKIAQTHAAELDNIPMLTLSSAPSAVLPMYVKRIFDVMASLTLALILSPVLLLVALSIKISSPHDPIFFVQARMGYNRRRFKMFKFRTMVPEAEKLQVQFEGLNEVQGPVFKITNDPRITPLGRFLRKTSLDELPQLFNVIKGDMSLVGPRPLPLRDVERFEELWLKRRFSVKPGITCLWQINGRSSTSFDKWIEQDLEYIDRWSFGLDLKILMKTIPAVLRGTGAH